MSYNPSIGRWMETDPEGYVDGANLFEFVGDDPIIAVDPNGTDATTRPTTLPSFPAFPDKDADRATREAFARSVLEHLKASNELNPDKCGCKLDPESLVAQWMMESNWGRSKLVQATFNFGNIKGQGPAGSTKQDAPEHINGQDVTLASNFRKYHSAQEFYADYAKLICTSDRYKGARGKSGRAYFEALSDAGYATDPDYVKKAMQFYNQLFNK